MEWMTRPTGRMLLGKIIFLLSSVYSPLPPPARARPSQLSLEGLVSGLVICVCNLPFLRGHNHFTKTQFTIHMTQISKPSHSRTRFLFYRAWSCRGCHVPRRGGEILFMRNLLSNLFACHSFRLNALTMDCSPNVQFSGFYAFYRFTNLDDTCSFGSH